MKIKKILVYGFLTWLIPFIVSFAFVDQAGEFLIPENFFKSIMVVAGALVGTFFAVRYFADVKEEYVKRGVVLGLLWLLINWILDLVMVYTGFFDMTISSYFTDIGIRYLSIPIYTIGLGFALKKKPENPANPDNTANTYIPPVI